jgi:dCTP deaminase
MLTDGEILELVRNGHIAIAPFSEANLTPNGYDLSVGGVEINEVMVEPNIHNRYRVPPLASFRVLSMETVTLSNAFVANLRLKQKYVRKGIHATFSQIDAEFFGTLTFGCFNGNEQSFEIDFGVPFCQITFEELTVLPLKGYAARSGHYKGQKNVVLK